MRPLSLPRHASFVGLACALALALAAAERLEAGDGIDWRRLAGLGALGAASAELDAGAAARRLGRSGLDLAASLPRGGGFETAPASSRPPANAGGQSTASVQDSSSKLLRNIEVRKSINGAKLTEQLHESIVAKRIKRVAFPDTSEVPAQYFALLDEAGRRIAIIIRYPAVEERSPAERHALQNVLYRIPMRLTGGILRAYARSHSPSDLNQAETEEVLLMVEPVAMTLRRYLEKRTVSLRSRIRAVFHILMLCAGDLLKNGIAHEGEISLDTVLITGDLDDGEGRAVVAPSLFRVEPRVFSEGLRHLLIMEGSLPFGALRPGDLLREDIRMCGAMFLEILDMPTEEPDVDLGPWREFARKMASGAFDFVAAEDPYLRAQATKEFTDYMNRIGTNTFEALLDAEGGQ